MSIVLDGTNGITTPDVDTDGLTVDTNTLFVDAANNRVGVGTSSPTSRLDVRSTTAGSSLSLLNLRADAAATGGATANFSVSAASDLITLSTGTDDALAFVTGGTSERARLDASGNLLVATTSGVGTLIQIDNISGSSSSSKLGIFGFGSGLGFGIIFRPAINTAATPVLFQNAAGTEVGSISTSTGTSTAYVTSSDYRLKEDVQPMVGSVDRLMALKPVNFAWKVDGSRVDGFLAHEAQEVVPECVTGEKDAVDDEGNPQYQGIDQSKIVPLLVAALQEALTKIEALEARVAALETNA
jgi:hypothetical protein